MKLHGSDTADANGSAPPIDGDEPEEIEDDFDYSTLFTAPSYSDFIKTPPNSKSREYERRVQSMMKAGMAISLNNRQWPDAATFLKHGPGFSRAAGNLAADDARAAQVIDMLTAPDSPYIMFAMVAIPMIAQLMRNHQPDIVQAGATMRERRAERKQAKLAGAKTTTPPVTVRIFRREFKLPIRFRLKIPKLRNIFKAFLAPTQHPGEITQEVFSDEGVIKALHKLGIYPREVPDDANS